MILRLVALVLLFGAVYAIQARIDETFGEYRATEEILYVESGSAIKRVLLGFEDLAADLYWLRTVQYFGGKRLQADTKDYDLLEPLLNITIELDPEFKIAYSYGATFLSEPVPTGAGMPEKGIEIIDKGIAAHPEHWRFYLDKGFLYFWFLNDPQKAAEILVEGSKIPGAPYWMTAAAGRVLTQGGERETARTLWQILSDNAETDQQRDNARVHMKQLDALDDVDRLKNVAERYRETQGAYPRDWQELITAGLLTEIPRDPNGVPYVLQPRSSEVDVSPSSDLGVFPKK